MVARIVSPKDHGAANSGNGSPNAWHVILLYFFHFIALSASRPYIAVLASAKGADNWEIGLIASSYGLVQVVSALFIAKVIDRLGSKRPMILGALLYLVAVGALTMAEDLYVIGVCVLLMGLSHAVMLLGSQYVMTGTESGPRRDQNIGFLGFASAAGTFVGPTIGGYAMSLLGTSRGFLAATVFSVCCLAIAVISVDSKPVKHEVVNPGFIHLLGNRKLIKLIAASATMAFCMEVLYIYFPVYGQSSGLSTSAIGIIFSINGLMQMVIRPFTKPILLKFERDRVFFFCILSSGICMACFGLVRSFTFLLLLAGFTGAALGLAGPLTLLAMSYLAPPQQRSQALALRVIGNYFGLGISSLVFGSFASLFGLAPVFWISGAIMALNAGLVGNVREGKRSPVG